MELVGLTKSLGGKNVLESVDHIFPEGKVSILSGANGAGKTTLLRIATGVLRSDHGKILWRGKESRFSLHEIGVCPADDGGFYPALTVRRNLEYFGCLHGIAAGEIETRLRKNSPLPIDYLDLPIERCSLGMRQKIKIARALMHEPNLLLLDEPLNGLDAESREKFVRWLERGQRTVILVQHGFTEFFPRFELKQGRIHSC